jgi:hypothetical protein
MSILYNTCTINLTLGSIHFRMHNVHFIIALYDLIRPFNTIENKLVFIYNPIFSCSQSVFIGLKFDTNEYRYRWVDGTWLSSPPTPGWAPGEPADQDADTCIRLHNDRDWTMGTTKCTYVTHYVCEGKD